jgi:hypothetical protein
MKTPPSGDSGLRAHLRERLPQIGAAFSGYMLVCGLIYSFTYFMTFGVNVFEFAPIDFYVRAALVGNAGLFVLCAILFTLLFVRWLSQPDRASGWVSWCLMGALTLVLPLGVGCYHAGLVRHCDPSADPYMVKVATSCGKQNGIDGDEWIGRSLNLVGIVGDRVILYDGQRTIAMRTNDVRSIEWEAAAIQARRSWWWPLPCPPGASSSRVGNQPG